MTFPKPAISLLLVASASLLLNTNVAAREGSLGVIDPALLGFGSPGVSAVGTVSEPMDFDGGGGSVKFYDGRSKIPVWSKRFEEGSVLGASLGYGWASLEVDGADALGLERQNLHSLEFQLTAAHFPKSGEGWMGLAIVNPGLKTDFTNVSGDDFSLSAILVGGYQFSPRFTLSAAAVYFHSIGEDRFIPGVGAVWKPNDEWIVQLTPPIAAIGWTPHHDWTISISAYPSGGSWDVDDQGEDGRIEAIKLDGWRSGLGVERRFGDHWRFNFQVGVNFGGELELRDDSERVLFGRDLDPSLFGMVGLAWSF